MDQTTTPEVDESGKLWQEYLQRCCEVGQIEFQLEQIDSQRKEIEKNLEVTQRAVRSAAHKHRELQKAKLEQVKTEAIEKAKETVQ